MSVISISPKVSHLQHTPEKPFAAIPEFLFEQPVGVYLAMFSMSKRSARPTLVRGLAVRLKCTLGSQSSSAYSHLLRMSTSKMVHAPKGRA